MHFGMRRESWTKEGGFKELNRVSAHKEKYRRSERKEECYSITLLGLIKERKEREKINAYLRNPSGRI